jgi:hypothetical protein
MNWCRFVNRGRLVRFTPATILIDLLPGNSRLVLLKTLVGFGIPTQALIPLGLIFRPDLIKHDLTTISFAYIASVWLWLGPLLVWRYERVTLKNFFVGCRYVVADSPVPYERPYQATSCRGFLTPIGSLNNVRMVSNARRKAPLVSSLNGTRLNS